LDAHASDRYIVDSEFTALGGELDGDAQFFSNELNTFIQIIDWVCAQNLGKGSDTLKATVDKLQTYVSKIIADKQYGTDSQNFISDIDDADSWLYGDNRYGGEDRDFTDPTKQQFLGLVDAANKKWCWLTDSLWDDWLKFIYMLGWSPDVKSYDKDVIDMNNMTADQINADWAAVAAADQKDASNFDGYLQSLTSALKGLGSDASSLTKLSSYQASTYGQKMSSLTAPDVFDSIGSYGGNQMTMDTSDQEYLSGIVKKYFPNLTPDQMKVFLQNATGTCWDFASINTLLEKYKDDPKGFQKKFGVSLMDGDDFNFDGIAMEYFCWAVKNHPSFLSLNKLTSKVNPDGSGATAPQISQFWAQFCKEHGIKVDVAPDYDIDSSKTFDSVAALNAYVKKHTELNVTPQNWSKVAKGGTIILEMKNTVELWNLDGSVYMKVSGTNVGHAVDIVGVNKNGWYIVSSYGKEYLVDPSQMTCSYTKISYK
jgi:hypothetical protein